MSRVERQLHRIDTIASEALSCHVASYLLMSSRRLIEIIAVDAANVMEPQLKTADTCSVASHFVLCSIRSLHALAIERGTG